MNYATAIPEATAKEWMSLAYLKAITAQAGLNIKAFEWDDGIDAEVGSRKPSHGNTVFRNIGIQLQLKSTARWSISDSNHIAFSITSDTYDKLIGEQFPPAYLVIYTLPPSRMKWLEIGDDHCRLYHSAYYLSLADMEPLPKDRQGRSRKTKTVYIPTTNKLTASKLLDMYKCACLEASTFKRQP